FLYDQSLHIVGANHSAHRLLGMSAEEVVGKHCRELFHCGACDSNCAILCGLGETECLPSGTVTLHMANGRERMVVIRTVQLRDDSGALEGVVATIKDITEETE